MKNVLYTGRPEDVEGRLSKEVACYDLLDGLGVSYTRVDHDFADTIEACEAVEQVLGEKICKNLFLCNRQKTNYYLLMMPGEKVFKTKDLSKQLGVARLSFASPEDMLRLLNIAPGSVSVLGLMNDKENEVQLVIDKTPAHPGEEILHVEDLCVLSHLHKRQAGSGGRTLRLPPRHQLLDAGHFDERPDGKNSPCRPPRGHFGGASRGSRRGVTTEYREKWDFSRREVLFCI